MSGIVKDAVITAIKECAIALDECRLLSVMDYSKVPALARAIEELFEASGDIAVNPTLLNAPVEAIITRWRSAVASANDAATNLIPCRTMGLGDTYILSPLTDTERLVMERRTALFQSFRITFGLLQGEYAAKASYKSKRDATIALNQFSVWCDEEALRIDPDRHAQLYDAFDRARASCVDLFVRSHTDLRPAIKLTLPKPTSCLVIATRVYGDPARSLEVWDSSGAPHPGWIGPEVEVSAV